MSHKATCDYAQNSKKKKDAPKTKCDKRKGEQEGNK